MLIGLFLSSVRVQTDKIENLDLHYANELLVYASDFWVLLYKKQIDISFFYASVLLLKINFVITLLKFAVEPPAYALWFHSHFDNVMMQFIINERTDADLNVTFHEQFPS